MLRPPTNRTLLSNQRNQRERAPGHRNLGIVNLVCADDEALDADNAHVVRHTLATQIELASE